MFKTVLIGFGKIGALYANDKQMANWFPYATHVQALKDNKNFELKAVVDPNPCSRNNASVNWNINEVKSSVKELENPEEFQVAVLATPPDVDKVNLIKSFTNLKAVMVEKPLALNTTIAQEFIQDCINRSIKIQVNFTRRGNRELIRLAHSLEDEIGKVQCSFALYGNGLKNNGSHLIDWSRMFIDEVEWVQATLESVDISEGPIPNDLNIPFTLGFFNKTCLMAQPLSFNNFRENSLDLIGSKGRLTFTQEGLLTSKTVKNKHRFLENSYELESDKSELIITNPGNALFELYENLAKSIKNNCDTYSNGLNALQGMKIIDAICTSYKRNGDLIIIE